MAYLETPDAPQPRALPQYLVGAASPLWAYFGAAAAGGVAFWWMTRWARPVNLEALFAAAAAPVAEPVLEAVEAVAELPPVIAELLPPEPAPIPVAEAEPDLAAESDAPAEPAPILEAAPEPVIEAAAEPVIEATPEPAPVVEAAAEPAPLPKPRVRKSAPISGAEDEA
jgi:hypothetical protein